jgi:alanine racemase
MSIRIQNIVPIKAKAYGNTSEAVIDTVSIDSVVAKQEHTLFFALVGPNNDAHAYIEDLIATGCKTLCYVFRKDAGKANFLIVETL